MASSTYLIAIGSNRRGRHGAPADEVRAGIAALGGVIAASPVTDTPAIGPSIRRFANAACVVESDEAPPVLLARLKSIERDFGRRRGQRWGSRVIDLDIILWSGGGWASPGLVVPHIGFRVRDFVIGPAASIAPDWRDPITKLTLRQLRARLTRRTRPPR
ncbi:2-amino-4-hydroxy-6-hydroxymethyldihydropteridine diphosphokinase [Sphingomonas sp. AX6]|uniref:2-amino-4-hydroxy-6- hydroxymethyldihydropteridine diphosphokinase n=1 Tax=Sphingomonas sp. AX6 TaxID=2653171 RepID=UPI0012F003B1|nr:2-amino-4-hydroxy-6-hydroxymethyldihydropteridine diphosphokinase [Sphingomonas sp. AX6]VXC82603.1 2-amino-4-hydroxy-6-hydroxymethyldihydropteridinepyrophosphokinase [Sphingomonas sp. AX6]